MIEDQVLTSKSKFDDLEEQVKMYKDKDFELLKTQAENTVRIIVDQKKEYSHSRHYCNDGYVSLFRITIDKGNAIPDEIVEKIKSLKEEAYKQNTFLEKKDIELLDKRNEIEENIKKIKSLPKVILWLAKVKL